MWTNFMTFMQDAQHNWKLIIEYPSDFFQVELSYVYTKDDVELVLHIPMVPTDAILQLMRYQSIPIPLRPPRRPLNQNHP